MIFDRTEEDVVNAKKIREEKLFKGESLTESDIETLEKGFITLETINRIESKQSEVALLMNNLGYYGFGIENKQWGHTGFFKVEDFERIIKNLDTLKKAFLIYSTTPQTPKLKYHYTNINDIEKIIFDIQTMIDDIKANFRECGDYECGGDNI